MCRHFRRALSDVATPRLEILLKPYLLFTAGLEKREGKTMKAAVQGKKKTKRDGVVSLKTQWHRNNNLRFRELHDNNL